MTRYTAIAAGFIVAFATAGCSKKNEAKSDKSKGNETTASAGTTTHVTAKKPDNTATEPAFDPKATKQLVQGKWVVGKVERPEMTFSFNGDNASMTSRSGKTHSGTLVVLSPVQLGIKLEDGSTYKYNYAKLAGKLHLGNGSVYKVPTLDKFTIKLSMFTSLEYKPGSCTWKKSMGGDDETRPVSCSVGEKDGKKVFNYQAPDNFDKTKLADRSLSVIDGYLVSEQFMDEVATAAPAK